MMRIFLILFLFFLPLVSFSKEIPVKIKPVKKITTSNTKLMEGDLLDFEIIQDVFVGSKIHLKEGQRVQGCITSIENNDFESQPAKIYIENFVINDNKLIKLNGIIYRSGNEHASLSELFGPLGLRGGEVQIKPEKDVFTIYIEEKQ